MSVDVVVTTPERPMSYATLTLRSADGSEVARARVDEGTTVVRVERFTPDIEIEDLEALAEEARNQIEDFKAGGEA
jgi:hypothetical protein